ncbi:MAG: ribonuclease P protein component [Planctomycetota bacterium]
MMNVPDASYRFSADQRIKLRNEFQRVLRHGSVAADGTLVVFAVAQEKEVWAPRLGITIPKKTGNAVVRNRWKRHIRECFRLQQDSLPRGFDFIVRPKKGATLNHEDIDRSVARLFLKAAKRAGKP